MDVPAHLAGIARHAKPRGPIEVIDRVSVSIDEGVAGNGRGKVSPGKTGRRQVSLIEQDSWDAAMAQLGLDMLWHVRRANLLVAGMRLPREPGAIIAIGDSLRMMVTCECDPCSRMDEIAPGLRAALLPDWRGGVLARVITGGEIALGDAIRIEA